jgi:hypothetical protein
MRCPPLLLKHTRNATALWCTHTNRWWLRVPFRKTSRCALCSCAKSAAHGQVCACVGCSVWALGSMFKKIKIKEQRVPLMVKCVRARLCVTACVRACMRMCQYNIRARSYSRTRARAHARTPRTHALSTSARNITHRRAGGDALYIAGQFILFFPILINKIPGVLVVTLFTAPGNFSCPMDCHYCPNERDANGLGFRV